jgi:hypothetical protein
LAAVLAEWEWEVVKVDSAAAEAVPLVEVVEVVFEVVSVVCEVKELLELVEESEHINKILDPQKIRNLEIYGG